ncbi:MAG: hypothetical protein AB2L14_10045 [Candidatus Xenobiia bacterium LiM19]
MIAHSGTVDNSYPAVIENKPDTENWKKKSCLETWDINRPGASLNVDKSGNIFSGYRHGDVMMFDGKTGAE